MNDVPDTELISAYLDGELTADEQVRVEQMLAASPAARQTLEEFRALGSTLQGLPPQKLDEDLSARVLEVAERRMLLPDRPSAGRAAEGLNAGSDATGWRWREISWRGMLSKRALIWSGVIVATGIIISFTSPPPAKNPNRDIARLDDVEKKTAPAAPATVGKDGKGPAVSDAHWEAPADPKTRGLAEEKETLADGKGGDAARDKDLAKAGRDVSPSFASPSVASNDDRAPKSENPKRDSALRDGSGPESRWAGKRLDAAPAESVEPKKAVAKGGPALGGAIREKAAESDRKNPARQESFAESNEAPMLQPATQPAPRPAAALVAPAVASAKADASTLRRAESSKAGSPEAAAGSLRPAVSDESAAPKSGGVAGHGQSKLGPGKSALQEEVTADKPASRGREQSQLMNGSGVATTGASQSAGAAGAIESAHRAIDPKADTVVSLCCPARDVENRVFEKLLKQNGVDGNRKSGDAAQKAPADMLNSRSAQLEQSDKGQIPPVAADAQRKVAAKAEGVQQRNFSVLQQQAPNSYMYQIDVSGDQLDLILKQIGERPDVFWALKVEGSAFGQTANQYTRNGSYGANIAGGTVSGGGVGGRGGAGGGGMAYRPSDQPQGKSDARDAELARGPAGQPPARSGQEPAATAKQQAAAAGNAAAKQHVLFILNVVDHPAPAAPAAPAPAATPALQVPAAPAKP
jgi:hypothetical protein